MAQPRIYKPSVRRTGTNRWRDLILTPHETGALLFASCEHQHPRKNTGALPPRHSTANVPGVNIDKVDAPAFPAWKGARFQGVPTC